MCVAENQCKQLDAVAVVEVKMSRCDVWWTPAIWAWNITYVARSNGTRNRGRPQIRWIHSVR